MFSSPRRIGPNSPNGKGVLNRRPTAAILYQDSSHIDRKEVAPDQDKHHRGYHPDNEDGPLEERTQDAAAAAAEESAAG